MSSKKKPSSRAGKARPILWIGGDGLPSGVTGRKLTALGHPLHWEPISPDAARSVKNLSPVLVVLESERITPTMRKLLKTLAEMRSSIDFVVFQLRKGEPRTAVDGLDGTLARGASLVQQIRVALDAMEGSRRFKAAGSRAVKRLATARAEVARLRTLAVKDDLTSLYNLRFFNRSLETEHQRAIRFGRSYSLVFMDLDGLREVNARRGHLVGAQVLKQVGEFLIQSIRRIDLPARIGGDEFVLVCPETSKRAARLVADRIRAGIQRLRDGQGKPLGITVSIGVASFPDDADLPAEVLQRADRALYEAKALGKNRVCCWGDFAADATDKGWVGSVHGPEAELDAEASPAAKPKSKPTVN